MRCKTKPEPHVMDRLIDRGISLQELKMILKKGNVTKIIQLNKRTRKEFIEHRL